MRIFVKAQTNVAIYLTSILSTMRTDEGQRELKTKNLGIKNYLKSYISKHYEIKTTQENKLLFILYIYLKS